MSHRKLRWTRVAAVLALAWGQGAWASDTSCAEERAAYASLKGLHEELRAEYGQQTGITIPVPISALGKRPKCKDLRKRYAELAKRAENVARLIDERENAELEEQRQAMEKHRKRIDERAAKREKEEQARRVREEKFLTDAQGNALKMQSAARAEHEAARKYLGKDTTPSATERLDAAVDHVERVHKLTKSFLGSLPAEFATDHQYIPVPWSPSQRRARN